jgi:hypothetical protein
MKEVREEVTRLPPLIQHCLGVTPDGPRNALSPTPGGTRNDESPVRATLDRDDERLGVQIADDPSELGMVALRHESTRRTIDDHAATIVTGPGLVEFCLLK